MGCSCCIQVPVFWRREGLTLCLLRTVNTRIGHEGQNQPVNNSRLYLLTLELYLTNLPHSLFSEGCKLSDQCMCCFPNSPTTQEKFTKFIKNKERKSRYRGLICWQSGWIGNNAEAAVLFIFILLGQQGASICWMTTGGPTFRDPQNPETQEHLNPNLILVIAMVK